MSAVARVRARARSAVARGRVGAPRAPAVERPPAAVAGSPQAAARRGAGGDSGYATVWAAGAVLVLVLLMVFGAQLLAATSGRHRAEAAADLAALAAAGHLVEGESVGCAYAARVVERMAASLVSCVVTGWEVRVSVAVTPMSRLPGADAVYARARAGPVGG